MSRLTFKDAKARLARYITNSDHATDAIVGDTINLAAERLINSGTWKGCKFTAIFTPFQDADGYYCISTPKEVESIDKIIALNSISGTGGTIASIQSQYYQFSQSGHGLFAKEYTGTLQAIRLGDGFPTPTDPAQGGQIVYFDLTGASGNLYVSWIEANGTIQTDIPVETSTTNPVVRITKIVFDTTASAPVKLRLGAADGTIFATADLFNPVPNFQRYRIVGKFPEDRQIMGLCNRAFVECKQDTDIVFPSNINALRYSVQAVVYDEANDLERAKAYWQEALHCLESENEQFESPATEISATIQQPNFVKFPNLI